MTLEALWSRHRDKRTQRLSSLISVLLPALWLVSAGYDKRWAGDDGFINLRVVRQLMAGNGFVYNAGERTEAVTSVAWVLVLWLAGELGLDLQTATWVLSLIFSFVGLSMAALATARLSEDEAEPDTLVLPLGVVAYAAIPVAWEYATSALENGLGLGFLGTAYYLLARAVTGDTGRWRYAIAAFCGLAPLLRPDYALFAAPLILVLVAVSRGGRTRALVALCAALPGATYEIFRMGYFACLVPNTAIAKEAFAAHWQQGLWYLDDTFGAYKLVVPLACVLLSLGVLCLRLVHTRRYARALVAVSMAGAGALHILYVVRVGGDFMHGRMLLPGLFSLFASAGVARVRRPWTMTKGEEGASQAGARITTSGLLSWGALLVSLSWAVYCASSLHLEPSAHGINDERRWYAETSGEPHPTRVEHYQNHVFYAGPLSVRKRIAAGCPRGDDSMQDQARDECPRYAFPDHTEGLLIDHPAHVLLPLEPGSTAPFVLGVLAFRPLGIPGLAVGLRMNVVDGFGLADAVAARMALGERGRPGHEKFFTTPWFAGKYLAEGVTRDERAITARRVLRCGLLAELHAATHEPMSLARFFNNMRLAFVLHGLRIPADPHEAERRFCS